MGFTLVCRSALNVTSKRVLERFKIHVFLLFLLLIFESFGLFNFDLVNDIESPSIVSLQIGAPQLVDIATLFDGLEEAVADVGDHTLVEHLVQVTGNFLAQSEALLAQAHQIFDLFQVVTLAVVLVLFGHLNGGSAVAVSDVFDEVGSISDRLTL